MKKIFKASLLFSTLTVLPILTAFAQELVNVPSPLHNAERNLQQENNNLILVYGFFDDFFNNHNIKAAFNNVSPEYKQHNPHVPDGRDAFVNHFSGYFKSNPDSQHKIVHYSTYEDLVFLHVHATDNKMDPGKAEFDIFRVKDGKIIEHWDAAQPVPEQSANKNTMF